MYRIYIVLILMYFTSCTSSSSVGKSQLKSDSVSEAQSQISKNTYGYTVLFGAVLDTAWNPLDEVRISTDPETSETYTDDAGRFELKSKAFVSDIPYIIKVERENYFSNSWTNINVAIDSVNEIGRIRLIPMRRWDAEEDTIGLPPEIPGGGMTPKDN